MLKISPPAMTGPAATLKLEGTISGAWCAELGGACEPLLQKGLALKLNLQNVEFLDPAAAELLWTLRQRGVDWEQASPFVRAQLAAARKTSAGNTQPPGTNAG